MIAALYLRKSNDEGDGSNSAVKSVAVQRAVIEKFAAQRGLVIDERYVFTDDGISGAEFLKRPGLQALLASLEPAPPFQALIVTEQSRLGRETLDTMLVIRKLDDAGVAIWSATEGRQITLNDETGELLTMLGGWRDTFERKKTITRVRNAALTRHATGFVTGGNVYGYRTERLPGPGKQPARRVIHEAEAAVVRRIFELTRDGHGLKRITVQLNAERVPAPRKDAWVSTGVREVLYRDTYRGVEIYGRRRRPEKKRGKTTRTLLPESEWKRREAPELRIVSDELWAAAHAEIDARKATFLRNTKGKLLGRPENNKGLYLLSGLLACGATIPEGQRRKHGGSICAEPLIVTQRGQSLKKGYVCRGRHTKGATYCSNTTQVSLDAIHKAVIAALRTTLSPEAFEAHLQKSAADDSARASRQAERAALLVEIPKLAAAEVKLAKAVAVADDSEALIAELKQTQTARKAAEARVAELEGFELDLKVETDAVERLREVWGNWAGALEADQVLARQILHKILPLPVLVRPQGDQGSRSWTFAGLGSFDGVLAGSVVPGRGAWVQRLPQGSTERTEALAAFLAHLEGDASFPSTTPNGGRPGDEGGVHVGGTSTVDRPTRTPLPLHAVRFDGRVAA